MSVTQLERVNGQFPESKGDHQRNQIGICVVTHSDKYTLKYIILKREWVLTWKVCWQSEVLTVAKNERWQERQLQKNAMVLNDNDKKSELQHWCTKTNGHKSK